MKKNGIPITPQELKQHQVIVASGVTQSVEWRFLDQGEPVNVRMKPRLTVCTNDGAIEAALQGLGVTRLMSYQVAPLLVSGKLKVVLSEFESPPVPVHIIHREGRNASTKMRAFIDWMAERLRADTSLN